MIHIRKGSRYDGVVEKVTAAIAERLTPEILSLIHIYHSFFQALVQAAGDFLPTQFPVDVHTYDAVSYTHLDVYKRQIHSQTDGCLRQGFVVQAWRGSMAGT